MEDKVLEAWLGVAVALLIIFAVSWAFRPSQAQSVFSGDCACLDVGSNVG